MQDRSVLLAARDDLLSPQKRALFSEYAILDLSALRYLWAYLNDLDGVPPPTITGWFVLWEYLSCFGVPLASSGANLVLKLLPLYTLNTEEKKVLSGILAKIPPPIRARIEIFQISDTRAYSSIADRATGTILTIGFSDMPEVTLTEIEKKGEVWVKCWIALKFNERIYYHKLCTLKRSVDAVRVNDMISSDGSL